MPHPYELDSPSGLWAKSLMASTQASHIQVKYSGPYMSSMGFRILLLHVDTSLMAIVKDRDIN